MITDFYSGTVLITGGAGYIGSHTVYELVSKDIQVVVIDNLVNSNIGNCFFVVFNIAGNLNLPPLPLMLSSLRKHSPAGKNDWEEYCILQD